MTTFLLGWAAEPGRPCSGPAGTRAGSALLFSSAATALSASGYHLALGATASATAVAAVASLLFLCSLLRPPTPRRVCRDLTDMVLAQASACCCFASLGPEPGSAGVALHEEAGAALHAVTTVVMVIALRTAASRRPHPPLLVPAALRVVARCLKALTFAYRTPTAGTAVADPARTRPSREDEEPVPTPLPTGPVGRRGPPWIAAPYISARTQQAPATRRDREHTHRRCAPP